MNRIPPNAVAALALRLRARIERHRQRRLLLLEGDADWGRAAAQAIIAAVDARHYQWIGSTAEPGALPPSKAATLLGGECGLLIIDAHGGFDADALGAAAGTLRGGGLLLLLTPRLDVWPAMTDPEAERIAVHPYGAADVGARFVARLGRLLAASPAVVRCMAEAPDTHPSTASGWSPESYPSSRRALRNEPALASQGDPRRPRSPSSPTMPATADQKRAIDAVHRVATGRARRPLLLRSDRGRGKSAALGIASAQLLADPARRIIVTAPRRAAAEAIFRHAEAIDPDAAHRLHFVAPDALLAERPPADLLLVDEAAGIPAPVLERLLAHYGRIVFATTVHGYEGSGRGFDLRFRGVLDRVTPGWHALHLLTPVRWAIHDPLEQLIDRALLLDAEPASDEQVAACLSHGTNRAGADVLLTERLDRDQLANDEALLTQVFGLLVLGHYQTRPADLRHLLDGPNMEVNILRRGDCVLATALTAREGRLPEALLAPIHEGRRRPRGHLLPQTLSAHTGLFDAPRLGYTRVVRIAVHPAARARGFGTGLVAALVAQSRLDGHDVIGASFGATPALLRFWRRCGLLPVQLGSRRNAASGAYSAVVLNGISAAGERFADQARRQLVPRLQVLLAGPLRQVDAAVVAEVLRGAPSGGAALEAADIRALRGFAGASRGFDAALPALHRLATSALPPALDANALNTEQAAVLIACVLQQRDWADVNAQHGLGGKSRLLARLRTATDRLAAAAGIV